MSSWIQLSKGTVNSFYRVPMELAAAEENSFIGGEHHPLDADGPWPLVAFLRSPFRPDVLTFQIFTLEAEALEAPGFNPLVETSGYLALNNQQVFDLARLLSSYAENLQPSRTDRPPMFSPLDAAKLRDFHIRAPLQPHSRDYFYRQTYDPEKEPSGETTVTLLIFSAGEGSRPAANLYFKIARFPLEALAQSSFDPFDHALAKVTLNRNGLKELAAILELRQKDLAG